MSDKHTASASTGISLGAAMAVVLSWAKWHSISWMIWHGVCGWVYVIYYATYYN